MVNHIKTVLANMTSEEARSAGLSFYIDPKFKPISVPRKLDGIRMSALGCCGTLDTSLDAIISVLCMPDMSEFLQEYDTRMEPVVENSCARIFTPPETPCDFSSFNTKESENYLFSRTRDEKTDKILDRLYACRLNDVDGYKGLSSMLFALVARLCMYTGMG